MRAARTGPFLITCLALGAGPAHALTIGFDCLTQSSPGNCAIGESQLSVEVSDVGDGSVRFHFRNAGPSASVIARIYFDDGTLLALASVSDGPGVDFEPDATPPNLPGGRNAVPPFQVTQGFLAQALPSPVKNGVGPLEWVMLDFTLQGGKGFADVVDDLVSGELRIGIHVIGFGYGGSESFVNAPVAAPVPEPVPEPGTVLLLGLGLALFGARRRRPVR